MKYYKIKQDGSEDPCIVSESVYTVLGIRKEKFTLIEEVNEMGLNKAEATAFAERLQSETKPAKV